MPGAIMKVRVEPTRADIGPVGPAVFSVEIYNPDPVIRSYDLVVLGVDPAWCRITADEGTGLALFPDSTGYATVVVDLPPDLPAGPQHLALQVTETTGVDRAELVDLVVERAPQRRVTLEIHPPLVTGGRRAAFSLVTENTGNAPVNLTPAAADLQDAVRATFDPPSLALAPRERRITAMTVTGRRPLVGSPEPRTVTVALAGPDTPAETTVTFVQKPWVGRGLVALSGLLAAATVFTLVLGNNLDNVVDKTKVDDALLVEAIENEEQVAAISAIPAALSGTVTETASGAGVAGVTVELYDKGDRLVALRTAATDDSGAFELTGVAGGSYKIRFVGAGFTESWYERAATFEGATEVKVDPGIDVAGLDVSIGGEPGTAKGTVIVDDPVGAVATLFLPGAAIGSDTDAVVATVNVASDGTFVFEQVPAPATYRLAVTKPGYAQESRTVTLGAAETIDDIQVTLRNGDGGIAGSVVGPEGPVGGITVTGSDGAASVVTSTLTTGEVGSFTLRDLVTPASYTITASGPGFRDEVVTVVLDQGQQLDGVAISLARNTGSVAGRASLLGAGPTGGVKVTVSDGTVTLVTTTLSSGDVGAWSIQGLPSPGTYTVTFSRPHLVSQTRSVDLDPLGTNDVTSVDASLTPAGAIIKGTVTDENGPVGGVAVAVSDGQVSLTSRSADRPLGAYEIRDVPPGTYTVTFSRPGSTAQTILATVTAGEVKTLNIAVATRASISGTIHTGTITGAPRVGAEVSLYRFEDFPLTPLRTVITGPDGTYAFPDLVAPANYVVEVAPTAGAPGVDSRVLQVSASQQIVGIDLAVP
jgi:5-hydroxyisourate hydrolase-like protein (transthyretin family)